MTTNPQTVEMLRSLSIDRSASRQSGSESGEARGSGTVKSAWSRRVLSRPLILATVSGAGGIAAVVCALAALALLPAHDWSSPAQQLTIEKVKKASNQQVEIVPPVAPAAVDAGDLTASGYVVARRKATLAAEITGKVAEVLIDEGMTVEAGQIVARLDDVLARKDYELSKSRVDAAEAAIGAIRADLEDAQRIFERTQSLAEHNYATQADLTKNQARVGVLQAQLRQTQSQLETARIDALRSGALLDKYEIRAPFPGVVTDRSAQPGEMISPMSAGGSFTRTGICTVVDMDSLEVEADVNEAFVGRIVRRAPVEARLDGYPDWIIPASVIGIVPAANREKATVKVRIRLNVKDPRILPDMAVKVTFRREVANDAAERADGASKQSIAGEGR